MNIVTGKCIEVKQIKISRTVGVDFAEVFVLNLITLINVIIKNVMLKWIAISLLFAMFVSCQVMQGFFLTTLNSHKLFKGGQ